MSGCYAGEGDDPLPSIEEHFGTDTEELSPADVLLRKGSELTREAIALMQRKNHDYTSGSGDPYANFRTSESFGVHPAVGIVIRIGDKLQRIRTFAERGHLEVDGEGLRDAVMDVINYAVLAYGLLTEGEEYQPRRPARPFDLNPDDLRMPGDFISPLKPNWP